MISKRFVYVGDRFSVLDWMLGKSLNVVGIYQSKHVCEALPNQASSIPVQTIESKPSLLNALAANSFDVLVSCGCPYILPISQLKKPGQLFINLHGSLLPQFPGPHPINAAMLLGADGGATCHHMNDQVDAGEIISQIKVPHSSDLDLGLMYVLTMAAEVDAFAHAFERKFEPDDAYPSGVASDTYFKTTADNRKIDFSLDGPSIRRHVRAFGMHSQGATFTHQGHLFKVFDASIITNPFLISKAANYQENEVVFIYDSTLVIKKGNKFLQLKNVITESGSVNRGDILEG